MPESLSHKLQAARRRWRLLQSVAGIAITIAILALLVVVSFWTDRALTLTTAGRLGWLIGIVAACMGALGLFLLWPLLRPLTDVRVATLVERTYPSLNERLLTTLSLAGAGGGGISQAMVLQLADETARIAASLDFPRAVPSRDAQRPAMFASVGLILVLGHALLFPQAFGAWMKRILFPAADIPVYAYTRVWVSPDDKIIPRGDDLLLGVTTEGRSVDRATLRYRFGNGPWAETPLRRTASDNSEVKFAFRLNDVQQDVTYYALAGDGQANSHTVKVEDRPALLGVKLSLEYPAYTRRPSETISATSANIVAPVGTLVTIDATANKTLQNAVCAQPGNPDAHWQVNGDRARGEILVRKDAACELRLTDTRGFTAQQPAQFSIRAQQDQAPQVKIEKPGGDVERTPTGVVDLRVVATDDYGVHDLNLAWQVSGRTGGMDLPMPASVKGLKQIASGGKWGLSNLNLKGGETLVYEALARDNDVVSGPHTGRSAKYQIHIVSASEMKDRLEGQKEQEREALKQLVERQREAQKQLDVAKQAQKPEQVRQAEAVQRAVASETADLAQRMKQNSQQMSDNNLTTPAEQSRRQQTEQELTQLSKQEMPQAAESVRKQDLSSAAQQEQAIKERLQALTQTAGPAQNAAQLAQAAEQLAQQQQKLAEKSANAEARMDSKQPTAAQRAEMNRLAQEQAAMNRQTAELKDQLNQAAREAAQQGKPEAKGLSDAARQMQQSGVQGKQSSAQQQLQSGKPGDASSQQNSASKDLQNLADKLDQASQQSAQQLDQRADKMDKLADQLQEMARNQQSTASAINRNPDQAQMQKLAGTEQQIGQKTRDIAPDLQPYQQVQEQVQRAGQNIASAEQQLNQSSSEKAGSVAREAARQLNQASMDMRQAAQSMRQAAEAKQAQEQVDKLAREQLALRNETRQTDAAKNGNPTPEQDKQISNEAEKQQQLTNKAGEVGNSMSSNAMKMISREAGAKMSNAARNLQQKNTGADTQRRQTEAAQILQRMSRALQQEAKAQQQQAENAGQQSGESSDMAQAAEDLRLAREMQAQVRQETGGLDERRSRNPERRLNAEQQQDLEDIARMQRETEQITQNAAAQLRSQPEMSRAVSKAGELMADIHDQMVRRRETGEPTQSQQDKAVGLLDQAIRQQQQAMRQQQQQQQQRMAQGQKPGQQQQQSQQASNQGKPNKRFAPIEQQQPSQFHPFDPRGKGFSGLDPRATQSMREGRQEKVPAEYRDLVNQYYKALSEKGR